MDNGHGVGKRYMDTDMGDMDNGRDTITWHYRKGSGLGITLDDQYHLH